MLDPYRGRGGNSQHRRMSLIPVQMMLAVVEGKQKSPIGSLLIL